MQCDPVPPHRGFGLGMRRPHYAAFVAGDAKVDFVEVISENFMVEGGRPLNVIDAVRRNHAIALHGVSMSIGSAEGLDDAYLRRLRRLADRVEPLWVSDHLCWTGAHGFNSHDLLPLPYTREAMDVVCRNIHQAQEALGRSTLLENPSSYVMFADNEMEEWSFLTHVVRRTGCGLLLDINNIYVTAVNHGFDPLDYLAALPMHAVRQIHLAGHSHGRDGLLIDTHDSPVPDPVWSLYERAIGRLGPVATMIERDDAIPALDVLIAELDIARRLASPAVRHAAA